VTVIVTTAFFIAQLRTDQRSAVNTTAKWALIVFAVLSITLAGWSIWGSDLTMNQADVSIIAGLILPGLATILVHWLIVRWRVRRSPPQFGRTV
jgi:hypothetical protein